MRFTWPIFYAILFLYRCGYSVIAQTIIARLTPLGDAGSFQTSATPLLSNFSIPLLIAAPRQVAQQVAITIGGGFHRIFAGEPILINVGFQAIAFVGIVALLRAVKPGIRIWLAALLMLPSFSIWSSVAGKEALVVFATGILGAYIVRSFRNEGRFRFLELLALAIVATSKPQYLPAFAFLFSGIAVGRYVRRKVFFTALGAFASLAMLYAARDWLSGEIANIPGNFVVAAGHDGLAGGRSTRASFWVERYDYIWKSPEGMFQSFFGPTLAEAQTGILQAMSFAESTIIFAILALVAIRNLPTLPLYIFVLTGFSLLWLLFGTYPFGIMNPGSAIRYRTGYEIIVFTLILVVLSRPTYVSWQESIGWARLRRRPPPTSGNAISEPASPSN